MRRTLVALVVVVLALLTAACGSPDESSSTKAKEPKQTQAPLTVPLTGDEVTPQQVASTKEKVTNVRPASGYTPPWVKVKSGTKTCKPGYDKVPLKVNGGVEYKGSQIGHATYLVDESGDVYPESFWVSSSKSMPHGLLVVSKVKRNYDDLTVTQSIDLKPDVLDGDQIVHISASDIEKVDPDEKLVDIQKIIGCFRK